MHSVIVQNLLFRTNSGEAGCVGMQPVICWWCRSVQHRQKDEKNALYWQIVKNTLPLSRTSQQQIGWNVNTEGEEMFSTVFSSGKNQNFPHDSTRNTIPPNRNFFGVLGAFLFMVHCELRLIVNGQRMLLHGVDYLCKTYFLRATGVRSFCCMPMAQCWHTPGRCGFCQPWVSSWHLYMLVLHQCACTDVSSLVRADQNHAKQLQALGNVLMLTICLLN